MAEDAALPMETPTPPCPAESASTAPPPAVNGDVEEPLLEDLRVVFNRRTLSPAQLDGDDVDFIGRQVGPYAITRLLGEGGMACVYLAEHGETQQKVAMKILKPQYRADGPMSARFEREARSMARIRHENVVRILDFPKHNGSRAIVMEYVAGGSLRQRISQARRTQQPVPIDEAVQAIAHAAAGCAAAHAIGIVHRDIKPSNLLLSPQGCVKVADFGTIMVVEGTTWLTGIGQRIGTPGYMSPEQCRGERCTPASDIYSLGISLYELLTGRLPFEVEEASPFAIMLKHLSEPPPDPCGLRADIPEALAAVILRALAKAPQDRYEHAAEFAHALLNYQAAAPATPRTPGDIHEHGWRVDVVAVRKQLQLLPQRAIVCWACRVARRVQYLMEGDPRVERALAMAESMLQEPEESAAHSLTRALSRIRTIRAESLKAAYTQDQHASPAAVEAAKAAAAAAASAAGMCVDESAADAAFAARSAIAALKLAQDSVKPFWEAALDDYHRLVNARLGREGTIGKPIPPGLFRT